MQVGSLVPAASCRLHVMDAVYTRMGASDNLAMGRSTFLEVCVPGLMMCTVKPHQVAEQAAVLCLRHPLTCTTAKYYCQSFACEEVNVSVHVWLP